MRRRRLQLVLFLLAVVPIFAVVAIVSQPYSHSDCGYPVVVKARVVKQGSETPIPNAFVLAFRSRDDADDPEHIAELRFDVQDWEERLDASSEDDRGVLPPGFAPWHGCGGRKALDGSLTATTVVLWSYDRLGRILLGSRTPPERLAVRALRIEIEGREPIILDAPHGTWTEHPDDDEIWATHDLGVIRIPAAGETGGRE